MTTVCDSFRLDPDSPGTDFKADWSGWLEGDTIATSEWVVPEELTKEADTFDSTSATIVLSGGVAGEVYSVVSRITKTTPVAGATIGTDRTLTISVQEL